MVLDVAGQNVQPVDARDLQFGAQSVRHQSQIIEWLITPQCLIAFCKHSVDGIVKVVFSGRKDRKML